MQLQKEGSGDLMSQSRTKHHSVPTRQLFHTVREKNQEAVQVSHVRADIFHSPYMLTCPTQRSSPGPMCPLCPNAPSNLDPPGFTFRNRERHIRALGTVTAWGRTRPEHGQNPQDRNWRRHFEEGESRMASCLHPGKGLKNHIQSVLTCSLSVAPCFFTCKKKISHERP